MNLEGNSFIKFKRKIFTEDFLVKKSTLVLDVLYSCPVRKPKPYPEVRGRNPYLFRTRTHIRIRERNVDGSILKF